MRWLHTFQHIHYISNNTRYSFLTNKKLGRGLRFWFTIQLVAGGEAI